MLVQKQAPFFKETAVVDGQFKEVSLDDYKGKYLVLFFYPLDFTFVCPTEICAFSDALQKFKELGAEVVACSTDSKFSHLAWINTPRQKGGLGDMQIPIIADFTKKMARDYHVLMDDGPDVGTACRGTFIIDPSGKVRIAHYNDHPIGRSIDETLRLLEALNFHAKHGEVCPVGWTRGKPTMKDDPKLSQEYFAKHAK